VHTHASSMSPSCSDCITATPYESPAQLERDLRDQPRRWCGGIGGTGLSAWATVPHSQSTTVTTS
jgi:hypothetical protein